VCTAPGADGYDVHMYERRTSCTSGYVESVLVLPTTVLLVHKV
jgi:hypothetical protein